MWERIGDAAVGLVFVTGAVLALRVLLQRLSGVAGPTGRRIRIRESRPLGSRSRIHLVDVDGRSLLLGSGDQGVTLVHDCGPVPTPEQESAEGPDGAERRTRRIRLLPSALLLLGVVLVPLAGVGQESAGGGLRVEIPESIELATGSSALDMLALLTVLAIAPSILLMATSFTRFVIVLAFVRQAIGVQNAPPNQVLIGLALFLTAFVMQPVAQEIMEVAYDPYQAGTLTAREAAVEAAEPVRRFLLSQTREEDLALFVELSNSGPIADVTSVPLPTLLPAFLISELRTAFEIGFVIFLPFLIVDLVVSSLLISMGMIVLPPIVVSLPFKIMLFVLVDGWNLILGSLVQGFL